MELAFSAGVAPSSRGTPHTIAGLGLIFAPAASLAADNFELKVSGAAGSGLGLGAIAAELGCGPDAEVGSC